MKKKYEKPLMEIIEFELEDTITSSGGLIDGGAGTDDEIFWNLIQ